VSRQAITITDRASGTAVEAVLDTDVPLVRLVDVEAIWSPYRLEAIRRFLVAGRIGPLPEHCHWNWARKSLTFDDARNAVFAIEAGDQVQGLMWLWLRDHAARLPPDTGQPLVYVDYLEAAPWNAREYTAVPRFKGVGTRLLEAAVLRSQQQAFGGRVGLHALPQSEAFYSGACGMGNMGPDAAYHNLTYFEFTAEAAVEFIEAKEQ
jgi:hypothetical protein